MTPLPGLRRRIALAMVRVTALALIVMIGGLILFQIVMAQIFPDVLSTHRDWRMSIGEGAAMIVFGLIGLGGAAYAGDRLARRIARPVEAVAGAARRVTEQSKFVLEELPDDCAFEETAQLVHDFNEMARRIDQGINEARTLNLAIAHELRTPLTIVKGRLQGFIDGVFAPNEAAFRALIAQVEGLARTADDLRTISLAASNRLELSIAPVDLGREAASVVEVMRPDFTGVGMMLELDASSCMVPADAQRVRQALIALLDNARRYAGKGRVVVQVRSTRDTGILRVKDEGPGISPEFVSRAFTLFERGEESRSRSSGGSGLGLSVVEAIMTAHGGAVRIDSDVDVGATFELSLPRRHSVDQG
ncbi:sensor histidine kinase [Novosphingobium album (ex Liu et al. 2023)]|uniref:histidine kinase n=1 Tax=Novosphingobium album (ex Liu et al. 2023) TaxID=3031130 RepID=A0ABT5WNX0_9SPHN|nr:HAMP domain-containing sensor histidine kinase [Novosphingobium album (ex Liu et al. 2023)]MDE8650623.1 HAMP domain-containing sensor histidine kinase [Novosphingobium album (ex Liu et al. 2023)]